MFETIKLHNGENDVPWKEYTRMFIGTYLVYEITKTIYPANVIEDRSSQPKTSLWNFIYGIKRNDFWEYLFTAFNASTYLNQYDNLSENDIIRLRLLQDKIVLKYFSWLAVNTCTKKPD
jgi:hypothetical protein